jgi:hypothetical protein
MRLVECLVFTHHFTQEYMDYDHWGESQRWHLQSLLFRSVSN